MTAALQQRQGGYIDRPSPSSLADVVELILDKGLVIDAYVRVSLVGIEILTVDARIVIASVDTYLRFAEATNRLDLYEHGGKTLDEMTQSLAEGGASGKTRGAISGVKEKASEFLHGSDDDDEDEDGDGDRPRRSRQSASSGRGSGRSGSVRSSSGRSSSGQRRRRREESE
jgi:hypothetical protein